MRNKMMIVLALATLLLTGCYSKEKDGLHWKTATPEQVVKARTNARRLHQAPRYSLVEFKGGAVAVLCGTSGYDPTGVPAIKALFEPQLLPNSGANTCNNSSTESGIEGTIPLTFNELLSVERIGRFGHNDLIYTELSVAEVQRFWQDQLERHQQ